MAGLDDGKALDPRELDARTIADAVMADLIREGEIPDINKAMSAPGVESTARGFNSAFADLQAGNNEAAGQGFKRAMADLEGTLKTAYESGGIKNLEGVFEAIDQSIDGKGSGIYGTRNGNSLQIFALRPVDERIAAVLNQTGEPSNGSFKWIEDKSKPGTGQWFETLAKVNLDLTQLKQGGQVREDFKEITGTSVEQQGAKIAARISSQLERFEGKGVQASLMEDIGKLVRLSEGDPALAQEINKSLAASGYSVDLQFKDGIKGLHGDTCIQSIVEIRSGQDVIARQLETYDTVRSFGGGPLPFEQSGVIKDAGSIEIATPPREEFPVPERRDRGDTAPATGREVSEFERPVHPTIRQAYEDAIASVSQADNLKPELRDAAVAAMDRMASLEGRMNLSIFTVEKIILTEYPELAGRPDLVRQARAIAMTARASFVLPEIKALRADHAATPDARMRLVTEAPAHSSDLLDGLTRPSAELLPGGEHGARGNATKAAEPASRADFSRSLRIGTGVAAVTVLGLSGWQLWQSAKAKKAAEQSTHTRIETK